MESGRFGKFKGLGIAMASLLFLSCGGSNYFSPMSSKDSDEAIFFDVLDLANQKAWDDALAKLDRLSSSFRAGNRVVRAEAGVRAGKCGLDFFGFFNGLGGSGALFSLFMSGFTTASVIPESCQESQNTVETLGGDAATRVTNLGASWGNEFNTFMAILGASKIGAQLRAKADADQDGTTDAGFDACDPGSISDAEVAQVGTGMALLITNFSTIASSFSSGGATDISTITAACAALVPNPCEITDPDNAAWADAGNLLAFRALINSTSFGIGACAADDPMNILPYPFDCCP